MFASKWIIFVCLLLNCSASEVKPGDDVTLQCQGPTDAVIDTVLLKWVRPDLKSEGYVFYFKDNQTQKELQHPIFHGRVELVDPQMKDGDFSVILKNVNINDTGTYECYVGHRGNKPQLISTINLTVTDSAEIKAKPGHDVTLECRGPRDAQPETVMLKWSRPDISSDYYVFYFRENRLYKDFQYESFHGRVELMDQLMKNGNFSVIVKNVNINDTGTYECYVGNNGNKPQLLNTVNLAVTDLGVAARRSGDEGEKDEGDRDVGITVGLSVFILVVVVVVGFIIYRKYKPREQNNHPPAGKAADHERQVLNVPETEGGSTGGGGGTPTSDMSGCLRAGV